MNLFISSFKEANPSEFVEFWKKGYVDKYKKNYTKNICNWPKTRDDIKKLYLWKNGMRLSKKKSVSLKTKILDKIKIINELKNNFDLQKFQEEFKKVSLIWKIFLLHIIKPSEYPIFDQYVHRSYMFIVENIKEFNDDLKDKEKEEFYFKKYLDFFEGLYKEISHKYTRKDLDEALFIFGQFLKSNFRKCLLNKKIQVT